MKLLRYGSIGKEKAGILDSKGQYRDLSAYLPDITPALLSNESLMSQLSTLNLQTLPLLDQSIRIGACINRPGKVLCVGYNSRLHAQEMGSRPLANSDILVFLKPSDVVCGPYDPILYGKKMQKLDWEAELAIIIGKKGKYIPQDKAKDYILGYTCHNDLSDRYLQLETEDKQFTKGKGFDNAAPLGPYLVTKDEIMDANQLDIKLWVNGELRQDFNTHDYIYNDIQVVSYLSQYFTLYPGDVISMGSAPGSAKSWGNSFLQPKDRVVLSISQLGQQEQVVTLE
jgi:2-keto-4-pentenoate hydratase/2-oxohepta-3-ene-1,7-dioic acid hydratase in catechol pathway